MVEENPWNNRITLKLNDEPLKRIDKKTFVYIQDGMEKKIVYGGNKLKGTYITIDDKTIPVFPKQPPYVWPLAILPFLLILILSNIPAHSIYIRPRKNINWWRNIWRFKLSFLVCNVHE